MALELKLSVRLTQQLVMTPQLQQAIKLLQLSRLELQQQIRQELDENPCLDEGLVEDSAEEVGAEESSPEEIEAKDAASTESEESPQPVDPALEQLASSKAADAPGPEPEPEPEPAPEPEPEPEPSTDEIVGDVEWDNYMESRPQTSMAQGSDDRPSAEDNLTGATSLADHLLWQLGFADMEDRQREIAGLIIGSLNDDGYLKEDVEVLAEMADAPLDEVEKVRLRLQEFDPVGVAAVDLSECLLVQMRVIGLNHPLALRIVEAHLDLLKRKDFRGIARLEDLSIEEVGEAARVIGSFEPRPGRRFAQEEDIYITPDIFVHKVGDEYHVVLNEDGLPKLKVSNAYRAVLSGDAAKETKEYVRERMRAAQWLIKSIHQRQRTIVKVMESILRFQRGFFDRGPEFLRPLNLRDVADDIEMHESTVSRVTTNKYTQTPHGVFELKFFFNSSIRTSDGDGIASESVKEKMLQIIKSEDPVKPYSDQKIAEILKRAGIHIARRTVTKYREALRILSSTSRREIG